MKRGDTFCDFKNNWWWEKILLFFYFCPLPPSPPQGKKRKRKRGLSAKGRHLWRVFFVSGRQKVVSFGKSSESRNVGTSKTLVFCLGFFLCARVLVVLWMPTIWSKSSSILRRTPSFVFFCQPPYSLQCGNFQCSGLRHQVANWLPRLLCSPPREIKRSSRCRRDISWGVILKAVASSHKNKSLIF